MSLPTNNNIATRVGMPCAGGALDGDTCALAVPQRAEARVRTHDDAPARAPDPAAREPAPRTPPCLVPYAGLATIHAAGPRAILGHVQWAAVDASAAPAVCSYARDIRGRSHNDMRAPVPAQKVLSAKSKFWQGLRQEDEPFRIKPALISAPGIG